MSWGGERVQLIRELLWTPGVPCSLCGLPILRKRDMHLDHRLPRALGGTDALVNLAPAHAACNRRKGAGVVPPAPAPSIVALPIARPADGRGDQDHGRGSEQTDRDVGL